jgi:hypothetical protein
MRFCVIMVCGVIGNSYSYCFHVYLLKKVITKSYSNVVNMWDWKLFVINNISNFASVWAKVTIITTISKKRWTLALWVKSAILTWKIQIAMQDLGTL